MSYIPDATVVTEPADTQAASSAALELRTLKLYLRDVLLTGLTGKLNLTGGTLAGNLQITRAVGNDATININRFDNTNNSYLRFQSLNDGLVWATGVSLGNSNYAIVGPGGTALTLNQTTLDLTLAGNLSSSKGIQVGSGRVDAIVINNSSGYLTGFNTAGTVRTGYLQFSSGSRVDLVSEIGGLRLQAPGSAIELSASGLLPYIPLPLGASANRWGTYYGTAGSFTGNVTAASFTGDGSALTNLPSGTVTNAQVLAALGFTPYNSSNPANYISSLSNAQLLAILGYTPYNNTNPANYISGISSGMVVAALGYTPYNNTNPAGFLTGITGAQVNTAVGVTIGSNAVGTRTVSTSAPIGGNDGDIWYQV